MYLPRFDSLAVTSAGAALLTAADVRAHGKITQTAEDTLIDSYIATATAEAQDMLGMVFTSATWTLYLPAFPYDRAIVLPRSPLAGLSAVTYVDNAGATQSFATSNLHLVAQRRPPVLALTSSASWPTTRDVFGDVRFILTMGFGAASVVPDIYRQLVRWLVLRMFEERLGPTPRLDDAIANVYRQHAVREYV